MGGKGETLGNETEQNILSVCINVTANPTIVYVFVSILDSS